MAAPCCPPDSLPPAPPSAGPRAGSIITLAPEGVDPIEAYLVGDPTAKTTTKAVFVYTDVFGFAKGRHRLFCDQLQEALGDDTCVVMPDFFRGFPILNPYESLPEKVGLMLAVPGMLYRLKYVYTKPERPVMRDVKALLPWLHDHDISQFGCAGFCFGGWCVAESLSLPNTPFSCGVGMHPSFNVSKMYGGTEEEVAKGVGSSPILLLPAGNDSASVKPGGGSTGILAKARGVAEESVSRPFADMVHGWMTRGDENDPLVARDQRLTMELCSSFLKEHMVAK